MCDSPAPSAVQHLYVALLHHPVIDKNGNEIASAVTNLDLHDIARAAKTFGVRRFYVVTPLADQRALTERIVSHWTDGFGSRYNPDRGEALKLIRILDALEGVVAEIRSAAGSPPRVIATCAGKRPGSIGFETCRKMVRQAVPLLLVFGTAWGLSEAVFEGADFTLEPIAGHGTYNHLSVRSAAAVVLDRLVGAADKDETTTILEA